MQIETAFGSRSSKGDSSYSIGSNTKIEGFVRGIVEYNRDPLRMGRVKVRVPKIHGISTKNLENTDSADRDNQVECSTVDPNDDSTVEISNMQYLPHQHLPWAYPCFPFASGHDFGSYTPPPVGSVVWVVPESGTENYVYFGGVISREVNKQKEVGLNRDFGDKNQGDEFYENKQETENFEEDKDAHGITTRGVAKLVSPPKLHELPVEVQKSFEASGNIDDVPSVNPKVLNSPQLQESDDYKYEPTCYIVYKSLKGHTISCEELIENESFTLVDRAGQILKFYSPVRRDVQVSKDPKKGIDIEKIQRGKSSCESNNPLDYYKKLGRTYDGQRVAYFYMQDVMGQILRFWAEHKMQEINLVSQDITSDSVVEDSGGFASSEIQKSLDKWKQEDNSNNSKDKQKTKFSRTHWVSGKRREDCGVYHHAFESDKSNGNIEREGISYIQVGSGTEQFFDIEEKKLKHADTTIPSVTGAELSVKENKDGKLILFAIKEDLKNKKLTINAKSKENEEVSLNLEMDLQNKKLTLVSGIGGSDKTSAIEMSANGMLISTGQNLKIVAKKNCDILIDGDYNLKCKKGVNTHSSDSTNIQANQDVSVKSAGANVNIEASNIIYLRASQIIIG